MTQKQKRTLYWILASVVLVAACRLVSGALPAPLALACYLVPYLVVGGDVLKKALKGIKNRRRRVGDPRKRGPAPPLSSNCPVTWGLLLISFPFS